MFDKKNFTELIFAFQFSTKNKSTNSNIAKNAIFNKIAGILCVSSQIPCVESFPRRMVKYCRQKDATLGIQDEQQKRVSQNMLLCPR